MKDDIHTTHDRECFDRALKRAKLCGARIAAGFEPAAQLEATQGNTVNEIIKALANNGYNTITINCYRDTESEE